MELLNHACLIVKDPWIMKWEHGDMACAIRFRPQWDVESRRSGRRRVREAQAYKATEYTESSAVISPHRRRDIAETQSFTLEVALPSDVA